MKKIAQILLPFIVILSGMLLMLYPWISNYAYEHEVASTVNVYEDMVNRIDDGSIEKRFEEARAYNRELSQSQVMLTDPFVLTEEKEESVHYDELLAADESGIMCFIEIPKIDVYLPVYHGTSTEVLLKGIGHIEGSTLPVGGEGTHAVLSGHTGVDKAKLFTDLTEMSEGDLFFIHVFGEVLAYKTCAVTVIEPEDTSRLVVEEGRDLVSLLTCTPYGVNSHRLVVTGERTEYSPKLVEESYHTDTDHSSQWAEAYKKALVMGGASALILFALGIIVKRIIQKLRKTQKKGRPHE